MAITKQALPFLKIEIEFEPSNNHEKVSFSNKSRTKSIKKGGFYEIS
jgi:hypothetical protein